MKRSYWEAGVADPPWVCGPAFFVLPVGLGIGVGFALGVGLPPWVCGPAHPVSSEPNMPNTIAAPRTATAAKTQTYLFVLIASS